MRKLFFIVGCVCTVLLVVALFLLKVKNIECTNNGTPCPESVSSSLNGIEGTRLAQASFEIKKRLASVFDVESFTTTTSPFGNVSVSVVLRKPVFAVRAAESEKLTLYTVSGIPAGERVESSLPTIVLKEQIEEKRIPFLVGLAFELNKLMSVKTFELTGGSLVVTEINDRRLLYPTEGDIDILLGATLITFSQLNGMDGKTNISNKVITVHEVDFRFKNPVLRE